MSSSMLLPRRGSFLGDTLIGGKGTRGVRSQLGDVTRLWTERDEGVRGRASRRVTNSERSCHRALDESGTRTNERSGGGRERERQRERGREIERTGRDQEKGRPRKRGYEGASARDLLDTRTTHRSTVPQPPPSSSSRRPGPPGVTSSPSSTSISSSYVSSSSC